MATHRSARALMTCLLMSAAATVPLIVLLPASPTIAEEAKTRTVWKWVDEEGITHYSDTEVAGAQRLEITVGGNLIEGRPTVAPPVPGEPRVQRQEPATATGYESLDIVAPAENASVVNTEGRIEITLRLIPPLADAHDIVLDLDGKRVTHTGSYPAPVLTRVARGTHRLSVAVVDAEGATLIRSRERTFHVKQTTAYSPQYPGRPEPPPPPPPWPPAQPQPAPPPPEGSL